MTGEIQHIPIGFRDFEENLLKFSVNDHRLSFSLHQMQMYINFFAAPNPPGKIMA